MKRRRRKCRQCSQLYEPDSRNRRHQKHCSQPACRKASKVASQKRWLVSPKGCDYFKGSGAAPTEPPFLDVVVIDFNVADAGQKHHVPLLVSPFGYSTYRGS